MKTIHCPACGADLKVEPATVLEWDEEWYDLACPGCQRNLNIQARTDHEIGVFVETDD